MPEVAPPASHVWHVPADWAQVDFISDLHLAPSLPRTYEALKQYLWRTSADAVVILGDLFEVWVGDDARHADFESECTALLHGASRQRPIAFMAGNRDFLIGPEMLAASGLQGLPDPTVMIAWEQRTLLTHGDAWCLSDLPYQRFRSEVRSPAWQTAFLSRPLAERHQEAQRIRRESQALKQVSDPMQWSDVDPATAVNWLTQTDCKTLVHGHTHRPGSGVFAPGLVRHVLSDWDWDDPHHPRAEILTWRASGWQRHPWPPTRG